MSAKIWVAETDGKPTLYVEHPECGFDVERCRQPTFEELQTAYVEVVADACKQTKAIAETPRPDGEWVSVRREHLERVFNLASGHMHEVFPNSREQYRNAMDCVRAAIVAPATQDGERSKELYELAYHGHGRGVVVTQPKPGHFVERPMTEAELAAREPAMKIAEQIHHLARYAAFAYINSWDAIAPAIQKATDAVAASPATAASPGTQEGEALFEALKHGDDDHRAWLREAIAAHFAGQPVPMPRGSGNKEAQIASHARTIEALRAALTTAHEAIELAVCLANEAANEWDAAPNGMKAGKILLALAGHCQGYSDKADKVNAALDICARALKEHPNG